MEYSLEMKQRMRPVMINSSKDSSTIEAAIKSTQYNVTW